MEMQLDRPDRSCCVHRSGSVLYLDIIMSKIPGSVVPMYIRARVGTCMQ